MTNEEIRDQIKHEVWMFKMQEKTERCVERTKLLKICTFIAIGISLFVWGCILGKL